MIKIRYSVGRGGVNEYTDVTIIQTLLNRHIVPPAELLKVDGRVGSKTVNAIRAFQHGIGMAHPDGRVDPGHKTFQALLAPPKTVPIAQKYASMLHDFPQVLGGWVRQGPLGSMIDDFRSKPGRTYRKAPVNGQPSRPPLPAKTPPVLHPPGPSAIAWGAKVSPEFKKRVIEICSELGMSADYLMTCMAFESAESFKADQPNLNGGKAIGLVQFTQIAIDDLNQRYKFKPPLTRDRLAKMTDVGQLDYVRLYFLPYKGKLNSLEDIYMVIICPAAVGRGPDGTVYKKGAAKHPEYYEDNKGLDKNKDGIITLKECSVVLNKTYNKGLSKGYFG